MKTSLNNCGISNYRLLDGVGAIAGHLPYENARPAIKVLEGFRWILVGILRLK